VVEKHLAVMDDLEQCQREAGEFMEKRDDEILVVERMEAPVQDHLMPGGEEHFRMWIWVVYLEASLVLMFRGCRHQGRVTETIS